MELELPFLLPPLMWRVWSPQTPDPLAPHPIQLDNALGESIFGLYKAEFIRRRGPWRNLEEVEFATLEWVDCFNHRRLFGPIGDTPPAEFEALYDGSQEAPARVAGLD